MLTREGNYFHTWPTGEYPSDLTVRPDHPHLLPLHSSGQNIGTRPNFGSLLGRFQIP